MALHLRDPAHRVSPRALILWHLVEALEALVFSAACVAAAAFLLDGWWRWAVIIGVPTISLIEALVVPQWRYRVHRWEVTPTAVYTQRGWWSRERRIAPMSRVQTVDFSQGPLARLFGLADVKVTTASAAGPLEIIGLDHADALALVDELTRSADLAAGDAT